MEDPKTMTNKELIVAYAQACIYAESLDLFSENDESKWFEKLIKEMLVRMGNGKGE